MKAQFCFLEESKRRIELSDWMIVEENSGRHGVEVSLVVVVGAEERVVEAVVVGADVVGVDVVGADVVGADVVGAEVDCSRVVDSDVVVSRVVADVSEVDAAVVVDS